MKKLLIIPMLLLLISCDRQDGDQKRIEQTHFWIPDSKNIMYFNYVIDNPDAIEANDQFKDTILTWITNDTIHFERIHRY